MTSIILITLSVFFFLTLFFILFMLFLGYVVSIFKKLENVIGETLAKLFFGILFIVGLLLLIVGWLSLNVHEVYSGAFLIVLSTLYFFSESVETY